METWLDRGNAYGGQETLDISALAGAENVMEEVGGVGEAVSGGVGEAVGGVGATEPPPSDP